MSLKPAIESVQGQIEALQKKVETEKKWLEQLKDAEKIGFTDVNELQNYLMCRGEEKEYQDAADKARKTADEIISKYQISDKGSKTESKKEEPKKTKQGFEEYNFDQAYQYLQRAQRMRYWLNNPNTFMSQVANGTLTYDDVVYQIYTIIHPQHVNALERKTPCFGCGRLDWNSSPSGTICGHCAKWRYDSSKVDYYNVTIDDKICPSVQVQVSITTGN